MICLLALIVFGILGIFSASHRVIAKEALDCVFRRLTLRKCTTGLDKRLKSQISGSLMRKHPRTGRFLYGHFEIISWLFTILLVWSLIQSGFSVYNYATYGNCNGKTNGEDFCVFDPAGKSKFSGVDAVYDGPVIYPGIDDDPTKGSPDSPITMIQFGCFRCPFTLKAQPTVEKVLATYGEHIFFVYRDFPIPKHDNGILFSEAAECAKLQGSYWEFHKTLFDNQKTLGLNESEETNTLELIRIAQLLGMDADEFEECLTEHQTHDEVENDFKAGVEAGVYGTPTFFINNRTIVGPKDFETFEKVILEELEKKGVSVE
ncbi:hypothetical protein CMO92_03075 [Candidatus Woesearchaeota archaeon]|nr:hypothetical protein [Candidatus Woesearchaeota archaeon]